MNDVVKIPPLASDENSNDTFFTNGTSPPIVISNAKPKVKSNVLLTKNEWILFFIILLHLVFFLIELFAGYIYNSIALITDSFHMLTDTVGFVIALVCSKLYKCKSPTNTYDYSRIEILGGFVNSIGLLTLCLSVVFDCISHIISPTKMDDPIRIFIIGCCGLLVNVLGMIAMNFCDISPHTKHDKETHDKKDKSSKKDKKISVKFKKVKKLTEDDEGSKSFIDEENGNFNDFVIKIDEVKNGEKDKNVNMQGVFLHLLADALGSIAVIITAGVVNWFPVPDFFLYYLDPILSLVMISFIVTSTLPLFFKCSRFLLQDIPKDLKYKKLKDGLLEIDSVVNVHHIHVWSLSDNINIGTAHIGLSTIENWYKTHEKLMNVFHRHNIHSTTLQPELYDKDNYENVCNFKCKQEDCNTKVCCQNGIEFNTKTQEK
uniref:Zinc transporter n=1 Tax=Parastrongyloides trichosuri TaxID=131310 RepID=A0A0N4Z3B6_PARTI